MGFFKSILRAVGQFHTKYSTYNYINQNSHHDKLSEINCPFYFERLWEKQTFALTVVIRSRAGIASTNR